MDSVLHPPIVKQGVQEYGIVLNFRLHYKYPQQTGTWVPLFRGVANHGASRVDRAVTPDLGNWQHQNNI